MPLKVNKKPKKIGDIRRAQVITTFGPGAIADLPDYSVIMAGTNLWAPREEDILREKNLERLLDVEGFRYPRVSNGDDDSRDLPAFRFPRWHFCPNCNRLMPYRNFGSDDGKKCGKCKENNRLVPSRFVAACINGHIEDFPYQWWVHRGEPNDCNDDFHNDNLWIEFKDSTGGLESIVIHCRKCGKARSMAGCMNKEALRGYHCNGYKPWLGYIDNKLYRDEKKCEAQLRALQRGGTNVYFSITASALTIPPFSGMLQQEIGRRMSAIKDYLDNGIDTDGEAFMGYIHGAFEKYISGPNQYSPEYIKEQILLAYTETKKEDYTEQDLFEDEYNVFVTGNYDHKEDTDFRISSEKVPEYLEGFVDDVVLVSRLREVLALRGFRRIVPGAPSLDSKEFEGWNNPDSDVVSLSDKKLGWLPAIEMHGEGIFLRLNEKRLTDWEERVKQHYMKMENNLKRSNVECKNFSVRYVLLHTLSHLLIRQLAVECGYSGASIKERIYSTYPDSKEKMCGILLYTSTSDSDGSLGGLVRNGHTEIFGDIFAKMLEEASWCSSDPLCIRSTAQGLESLNYAACHACTLLPETCCTMRNTLLDRAAVVGGLDEHGNRNDFGYFAELLSEEE